ncbi:MAG: AI-2E family transporter [Bacteroidota bacterium]
MKFNSRNIAIFASLLLAGYLIYMFREIVTYVLIAWVIAMLGQPIKRFFEKKLRVGRFKAGPIVSTVLTLLVIIAIFSLLFLMFVPLIIEQAGNLAGVDYRQIAKALEEPVVQVEQWLKGYGVVLEPKTPEELFRNLLQGVFEPNLIGDFFTDFIAAFGGIVITLFSVLFISFFFLKEEGLFTSFLVAVVPNEYEQQVRDAVDDVTRLLTRYFGGIVAQVSIITLYVTIFLSIFGVKNALLIGFFAGVINVIPYLGPIIGAAFGIFITVSSNLDLDFYNEMLPLLGKVILVFATMQLLDNFLLQPFIFSNSVLAHPLEIFIVVLMGAQVGGISGMVLAIPAYTVLRVIARVFLSQFKIVKQLTDRMEEEDI